MKKQGLLIIEASKRENGFSKRLSKYALSLLGGFEVTLFNVFENEVIPCDGCNFCENAGRCRHRELDAFFWGFENADFILIFSPVYNESFPAPMKALLDRFQVYYTSFYKNKKQQPIKKRRKAALAVSCGRSGEFALSVMERQLKNAFSVTNIEFSGSVLCNFTDTSPDLERAEKELRALLFERMFCK